MIEGVWRRINQNHATNYIALISIIQSANIGFLIYVIESSYDYYYYDISCGIIVATTILAILCVWHEYTIGGYCFTWIPGFRDTIIPFALGFFEYRMIRSLKYENDIINVGGWYFWTSLFSLAALAAYLNMFHSAKDLPDENREVLEMLSNRPNYIVLIKYFLLVAALSFFTFFYLHDALGSKYRIILSVVSFLIVITMIVGNRFLYWKRINRKSIKLATF